MESRMTLNSDPPASTSLVLGLQGTTLFLVYAVLRTKPRALCLWQEFSELSHISCPLSHIPCSPELL